jgi:hypothetical protein
VIATHHPGPGRNCVRAFALRSLRSDIGSPRPGFFVAFGEAQVVAV